MKYDERMSDGQTIGYKILGILQHIAPDAAAQQACTTLYNSASKVGVRDADRIMVGQLANGLFYNRWPWDNLPNIVGTGSFVAPEEDR